MCFFFAGSLLWHSGADVHFPARDLQHESPTYGFDDFKEYDEAPAGFVAAAPLEEHFAQELRVLNCAENG